PVSAPTQPVTPTAANTNQTFWSLSMAGDVGRAAVQKDGEEKRESAPQAKAESRRFEPALSLPEADELKSTEPRKKAAENTPVSASPATPEITRPNPTAIKATVTESKPIKPTNILKARATRASLRSAKTRARRNRSRPKRRRNHHTSASEAPVPTVVDAVAPAFTYALQRKDHNIYYTAALNGERENFFGPVVVGNGPNVTLTLSNIETTSPAPAQLQVNLQGVSLETHQVSVFVNSSLAGTIVFSDQTQASQTFAIPTSWLVEGDNAVKLVPVGSSHDTSVMESLRVSYPHSFRAENNALQLSVRANQSSRISGFTTSDLRVLDITDPNAVQEVDAAVESSGGGFLATIPSIGAGKARRMVALPATRLTQPAWLSLNQPSTLTLSSNAASLVIISHKDFIPALAPLVAQRQAQGFTVMVVNVEDVFDEFSYGTHTPQAIRDFMALAKTSWAQGPAYLLLVGDASYDPRNYLGVGNFDFVPSKQIDTGTASTDTALETASDDWLT